MGHQWLFFRRWLANPRQMGSIIPTSASACRLLAAQVCVESHDHVIEVGAGTGAVSRALLEIGIAPERLLLVEIEPTMADLLRARFPGVRVVNGDAMDLAAHLPTEFKGRVSHIICGIPLMLLPFEGQRRFVEAVERIAPGRGFLQLSYQLRSPIPADRLGLSAARLCWTLRNLPPAGVWRYQPASRLG
jgi:phosphatidylethanolamine/phosphatidyl-N-methylethanolamine N-methyltransferase